MVVELGCAFQCFESLHLLVIAVMQYVMLSPVVMARYEILYSLR